MAAALALTALAVVWQAIQLVHSGGLWRDEATSINVATASGFRQLFQALEFDSYPLLYPLILRGWNALGWGDDFDLRVLGFLVAIVGLGCLWFAVRQLKASAPTLAVGLLACNPWMVRLVSSNRAYGLGVCFVVLNFASIWRLVESPSRRRLIGVLVVSLLAVQCLYYNSLYLFAFIVAGVVVLRRRGDRRTAVLLVGVGVLAALTLLPYVPIMRRVAQWSQVCGMPLTGAMVWDRLKDVLVVRSPLELWLWLGVGAAGLLLGLVGPFTSRGKSKAMPERDRMLFCGISLLVGTAVYVAFIFRVGYVPQPWYFICPMTLLALAADGLLNAGWTAWCWRLARGGGGGPDALAGAAQLAAGARAAHQHRLVCRRAEHPVAPGRSDSGGPVFPGYYVRPLLQRPGPLDQRAGHGFAEVASF